MNSNFPLQSWIDTLEVGSPVTYIYSLGQFPATVDSIDGNGIWVIVETANGDMMAKVGTDGLWTYGSYITPRATP
jgi:hypothetical protein